MGDQGWGRGGASSSPSPREERVGRGLGRGESLENIAWKRSRIPKAPLSLTLSPLRREREFVSQCRPSCDLLSMHRAGGSFGLEHLSFHRARPTKLGRLPGGEIIFTRGPRGRAAKVAPFFAAAWRHWQREASDQGLGSFAQN